jgi:hypothetical protein
MPSYYEKFVRLLASYQQSYLHYQLSKTTSVVNEFHLEAALQSSPLNNQFVSWFPSPDIGEWPGTILHGFFGVEVRPPSDPLPVADRALFRRDSHFPEYLFFVNNQQPTKTHPSAVPQTMEHGGVKGVYVDEESQLRYASASYHLKDHLTGNFSVDYITRWPDLAKIYYLDFKPVGFTSGSL